MTRHVVSVLILIMALSSAALADECLTCRNDLSGAIITQTNDQGATAGLASMIPGYAYMNADVQETAANWAIVTGNRSYLYQGNEQYGESAGGTAQADGTNLALIIGDGNDVYQGNYAPGFSAESDPLQLQGPPAQSTIDHMNELILLGDYNHADQSNIQEANLTAYAGSIDPEQTSFGFILGENNTLIQSNTVHNESNDGFEGINQTQDNTAYIFGFNNMINQTNIANATINIESPLDQPLINQTEKNLAFAISACVAPEFIPECNNTTMTQPCPSIPAPPSAPAFPISSFPLDP